MADFRNKAHCCIILWLETNSIWFQNKYAILQHPTTTQPDIHWAPIVSQVWISEPGSVRSPARFFRTTTTPLPSAAGSMPTVLRWMRPLKRKAFLAFRLFGSWKTKSESNDYLICIKKIEQMSNTEEELQQCSSGSDICSDRVTNNS